MNVLTNMNKMIKIMAWLGVLTLAADGLKAAERPKKETAAAFSSADEVVAKGKGCEVKRSQIDNAFIAFKANAAARGQMVPESAREQIEGQILDRLIFTQLLLAKATETDKIQGKEAAEKYIQNFKTNAPSEESFNRQLVAMGLTPEQFRTQMLEQGICEQVLDRELKSKLKISDADAKKYYEDNAPDFQQAEQIRAAHILIATKDKATNADLTDVQKKEKKKLAEKVLARARTGEDFAKLVKEFSDDPGSKDAGGEYTFPRGQMVPEFEAAAFSMKTNQISDLVATEYGFHIIKVNEKIPANKVEYAKVEKEIKERLELMEIQKQLPDYLEKLKTEAKVEILAATGKSGESKK
jgi:peptidyl-prolyl cis-trans isomerase C